MTPTSNTEALAQLVDLDGIRALDVGCGRGELLRFMQSRGARATGVECNPLQIEAAVVGRDDGIEIVEGVGQDLPFGDGSFDLVVFMFSLHHVPVALQGEALREAARALAPGGMLYVAEPLCEGSGFEVHAPVDDETEVRAAALEALRGVAAAELTPLDEIVYTFGYHYESFEEFRNDMIRIDPTRRESFDTQAERMADLFGTLGVEEPEGIRFEQPVRVNMYRKDFAHDE